MFTFKLLGIDLMRKQTKAIAAAVESAELRKQFYAKAKGMADEMKARAPKGPTGNLRRAIFAREYRGSGVSIVGVDRKKAPHAHWIEFGTSKVRRPKKKKVMISKRGEFFGTEVGPMPAQPFFRPVVDGTKGVRDDIEKAILKAIK